MQKTSYKQIILLEKIIKGYLYLEKIKLIIEKDLKKIKKK